MGRDNINSSYALVTGGSCGLGRAMCMELASKGHDILIVSLPDTGQVECTKAIKDSYSVEVKCFDADLSQLEDISKLISWINDSGISIQVLINNAGMGFADSFDKLSFGFISTLLDVNMRATVLLTRELIPILKKNDSSYILNVSSAAAFYVMPYKSIYAASKKFVMDFSMAIREELKDDNVFVTTICPAGIITSEEIRERINKAGAISKASALEPEYVAKSAIAAMLKKRAYYVPGKLARLLSYGRFVVPSALQRKMLANAYKKKI